MRAAEELLARYGPDTIVSGLGSILSAERRERIEQVLDARLASLTVVLEDLHDPHNGAAALRSIEAYGIAELHVVEPRERFRYSAGVTRGCEKWLSIHRHRGIEAAAQALRSREFRLYATAPEATSDIDTVDVSHPFAVMFGNEHDGISAATLAMCDDVMAIPMFGFTQSFNLSVSVAVAVQRLAARRRAALGVVGDLADAERARLRARWYLQDVRGASEILRRYVAE